MREHKAEVVTKVEAVSVAVGRVLSESVTGLKEEQFAQNQAIFDSMKEFNERIDGLVSGVAEKVFSDSKELHGKLGAMGEQLAAAAGAGTRSEELVGAAARSCLAQDERMAEVQNEVRALREQVGNLQLQVYREYGHMPAHATQAAPPKAKAAPKQEATLPADSSPTVAVPAAMEQAQRSPKSAPQSPKGDRKGADESVELFAPPSLGALVQGLHGAMGWQKQPPQAAVSSEKPPVVLRARMVAESNWFIIVSTVVLMFNLMVTAAETDVRLGHLFEKALHYEGLAAEPEPVDLAYFATLEWLCLVYMTGELIINLCAFGIHGERGMWNLFDAAILGISIVQQGMDNINISHLRTLRLGRAVRSVKLLRTSKVLKVVRVIKHLSSVRKMLISMLGSIRSLMWALLLMASILFLVALGIMQGISVFLDGEVEQAVESHALASAANASEALAPERDPNPVAIDEGSSQVQALAKLYGSLGRTMLTLFAPISGGAEWTHVAAPVMQISPVYAAVWIGFICMMLYGVLNILTGVFVEAAINAAHSDRDLIIENELAEQQSVHNELQEIFNMVQPKTPGFLTLVEFTELVERHDVSALLGNLDLHVSEAVGLFKLLDADDSGLVCVEEFLSGCVRLRGRASAVDMVTLMFENRRVLDKISTMQAELVKVVQAVTEQ